MLLEPQGWHGGVRAMSRGRSSHLGRRGLGVGSRTSQGGGEGSESGGQEGGGKLSLTAFLPLVVNHLLEHLLTGHSILEDMLKHG
jgi:hypothetical protein